MERKNESNPSYISQLDGLRAIAIILVLIFHWYPEGQGINILANGPLGVTIFFVLSGFLITRILLNYRQKLSDGGITKAYKVFMARRMLRIFPLYYLVLLVVWLAQYIGFIPPIGTQLYSHPLYYILYASNFLIEYLHDWSDVLSPFWSLAVEEQFYIFFPLLILSVPQAYLKKSIIGLIVLGIVSRVILHLVGVNEGVHMPTCLDAFGLGALWAYLLVNRPDPHSFLKLTRYGGLLGMVVFIVFCLIGQGNFAAVLFFRTSMSLIALYLVAGASYKGGFANIFGSILNHQILKYIGKISYGLYVFHMLVPAVLVPLLLKLLQRFAGISIPMNDNGSRILSLSVLLVLATASWYLYEKPIIQIKKYFEMRTKNKVRVPM
ncbi:peptidoglycan/LPS O-acetylase OafA/YrhL [Dyadobacter jejuensis]|uniref:Peptidoglycan/LPS O-acetylase OafA/YrhL n=1 Tax=Dyadobacter jejuensis TaxID=1082580 RepID=A0A316APP6_9BACT|nr:acyltransferase [Dyadobacter jejuensis]PWJ59693.1 peptidoglycan/LPS O-acetylase OafA/YrhL [Dyadobacter jejuensis]